MQNVPGFPTDLTVGEPSARVLVDGVPVAFESVSIQSELESAMPAQVAVAGGAVVAATGNVVLLPGKDVAAPPSSPWGAGVPANTTEVVVEAGYGDALAKQFTGVTDGASGAPSDPTIPVSLIDWVDQLDRPITMEPLLNVWPSLTEGSWTHRRAGLSPMYITNRVLRHCGFYATPPMTAGCVVSVPAMGSAWPEHGTLVSAESIAVPGGSVSRVPSPWGEAWADGKGVYIPALGSRSGRLDETFQMTFMLSTRPNAGGNLLFAAYWGTSGIRIAVTPGRGISLQTITSGAPLTIVTLPGVQITDAMAFTARVTPGGSFAIYADNGANVVGTGTIPPTLTASAISRVEISVPIANHPAGGFQVGFTSTQSYAYTRNAHLTAPAFIYSLRAFPAVIDRNCADLLKEQAEAELAAMWLDENGHFRWVNRNVLAGTDPVGTLTSESNLLDLPWETPAKSVYSRVDVVASIPTTTIRAWPTLTLAEGGGSTLNTGDDAAEFIEPPAEESWFMVRPPVRGGELSFWEVKSGRYSVMGGTLAVDGSTDRWATATELNQNFARLSPQKWLLTSAVSIDASEQVDLKVPESSSFGKVSGSSLYVLRGRGLSRVEESTFVGAASGPVNAPVLRHTVGSWIQDVEEIQALADWLAQRVTTTAPIIRDVPIVPDPRIQKGDVFWLEDTHAYGVRLKVLVMGLSLTINAGPPVKMEQSITCRIIEAQRTHVSLDEHDAIWAGKTLGQHDAFWAGKTLAQHDASPLAH